MHLTVRAFANFREIIGKEIEVELMEGSTVKDLLEQLCLLRRNLREEIFDETGGLKDNVIMMKNRKNIDTLMGLSTVLEDGDEVAIFPPVAGG